MNNTNEPLHLVVAYWCAALAPMDDDRFTWSTEQIDKIVSRISSGARDILTLLAETAPSDQALAYFAAGPLEQYIHVIAEARDANEAYFITHESSIVNCLDYVWGDMKIVRELADNVKMGTSHNLNDPNQMLKLLHIQDVIGFWMQIRAPQNDESFSLAYDKVINNLLNPKIRDRVKLDLDASVPDEKAKRYLDENIYVLSM